MVIPDMGTYENLLGEWAELADYVLPLQVVPDWAAWASTLHDPCPLTDAEHEGGVYSDDYDRCRCVITWWVLVDDDGTEVLRSPSEEVADEVCRVVNAVLSVRFNLAGERIS